MHVHVHIEVIHTCLNNKLRYVYTVQVMYVGQGVNSPVHIGTWQNRDESVNLLQKHDVELIKDAKRSLPIQYNTFCTNIYCTVHSLHVHTFIIYMYLYTIKSYHTMW